MEMEMDHCCQFAEMFLLDTLLSAVEEFASPRGG
jgi:hypothetical protein